MTANGVLQMVIYLVVLIALAKPLGAYMARVYEGRPFGLDRALGWLERLIYRVCGVKPSAEMDWKTYAAATLAFNFAGLLAVYLLQRLQGVLPLNPEGLGAVSADSAFNTAVSFATNTNWQGYGGETTMSYLTQMLGLTVQNFVSAARRHGGAGRVHPRVRAPLRADDRQLLGRPHPEHAVHPAAALARPRPRARVPGRRADLRPVCQGRRRPAHDLRGAGEGQGRQSRPRREGPAQDEEVDVTEQMLAVGPAASQIAIKQLGTNGGGFFNVNSAHPFENPTPLSNFLELLSILLIPAALCYTFGEMVRTRARAGRCSPR